MAKDFYKSIFKMPDAYGARRELSIDKCFDRYGILLQEGDDGDGYCAVEEFTREEMIALTLALVEEFLRDE